METIKTNLIYNGLKIDLINKAGISRSGFGELNNRYIYIRKK